MAVTNAKRTHINPKITLRKENQHILDSTCATLYVNDYNVQLSLVLTHDHDRHLDSSVRIFKELNLQLDTPLTTTEKDDPEFDSPPPTHAHDVPDFDS
jgi:hypothetical protein